MYKDKEKFNWFEWVSTPLMCVTANSCFKVVRAAGPVFTVIFFPWFLVVMFVAAACFFAEEAAGWIKRWWGAV